MSKHTLAADIAARRKSLAEDSAENVEQIVLNLLQAEDESVRKILSSCGATSVEHLRDKYLEALHPKISSENKTAMEKELTELCGQILATLRVNFLRGTLTTEDNSQFETMLDAWAKRLNTL